MSTSDAEYESKLSEQLDRIESAQAVQDERLKEYETRRFDNEVNRITLLYIHGGFGLLIALVFPFYGALQGVGFRLLQLFPWHPGWWALVMGIGSMILLPAVATRAKRLELLGLRLITLFYVLISANFLYSFIDWLAAGRPGIGPAAYAIFVYLHVSAIMIIQINTLQKLIKQDIINAKNIEALNK